MNTLRAILFFALFGAAVASADVDMHVDAKTAKKLLKVAKKVLRTLRDDPQKVQEHLQQKMDKDAAARKRLGMKPEPTSEWEKERSELSKTDAKLLEEEADKAQKFKEELEKLYPSKQDGARARFEEPTELEPWQKRLAEEEKEKAAGEDKDEEQKPIRGNKPKGSRPLKAKG